MLAGRDQTGRICLRRRPIDYQTLIEGLMQSQHPDDTKNMMLAVALAMAVLFGWNYFYAAPQIRAQQEKAELEKKRAHEAAASSLFKR